MRRRYVYRPNAQGEVDAVEVTPDYQCHEERAPLFTDRFMEGHATVDGVDIGSRTKRREYMSSRGLADASDFTGEWARAEAERSRQRTGGAPEAVRDAIARVWHQHRRP
jgi:hypothetical protein